MTREIWTSYDAHGNPAYGPNRRKRPILPIVRTEEGYNAKVKEMRAARIASLRDGDKDWDTPCVCCSQLPTCHPTQLCGPCCFGEADTLGGNW